MNPAVHEIIFVDKSFESAQPKICELYAASIDANQTAALTIDGVLAAADLEPVQMNIVLPEDDLQDLVQLRHRAIVAH